MTRLQVSLLEVPCSPRPRGQGSGSVVPAPELDADLVPRPRGPCSASRTRGVVHEDQEDDDHRDRDRAGSISGSAKSGLLAGGRHVDHRCVPAGARRSPDAADEPHAASPHQAVPVERPADPLRPEGRAPRRDLRGRAWRGRGAARAERAGKTTTIEILEGFRCPSGGAVRSSGRIRRTADELAARVGVVLHRGGTTGSRACASSSAPRPLLRPTPRRPRPREGRPAAGGRADRSRRPGGPALSADSDAGSTSRSGSWSARLFSSTSRRRVRPGARREFHDLVRDSQTRDGRRSCTPLTTSPRRRRSRTGSSSSRNAAHRRGRHADRRAGPERLDDRRGPVDFGTARATQVPRATRPPTSAR